MVVKRILALTLILSLPHIAQARVFDRSVRSMAPYLRVQGGLSQLGQSGFDGQGASVTSYTGQPSYFFAAEVGVLMSADFGSIGIGGELFIPSGVDVSASNSGGASLFSGSSRITGYGPLAFAEIALTNDKTSRWMLGLGSGYDFMSVENSYTLTTAGQTAFSTPASVSEKFSGAGLFFFAYISFEMPLAGNTGVDIEAGYRYYTLSDLEYSGNQTTLIGAATEGSSVLKSDGSKRSLDLGGPFVSVSFRFHHFLE